MVHHLISDANEVEVMGDDVLGMGCESVSFGEKINVLGESKEMLAKEVKVKVDCQPNDHLDDPELANEPGK